MAAAWALLVCATTLLTAGTLYGDTVALGGIRAAIDAAPAADRSIVVKTAALAANVEGLDGPIRTELRRLIERSGGEIAEIVRAEPFAAASADPASATTLIDIAGFKGIDRHAALTEGRWPVPGAATPEATLSVGAAIGLGVGVGDQLRLVGRLDAGVAVSLLITGIWRPVADDPYWLAAPQELEGVTTSGGFTTVGPVVVASADLAARPFGARRNLEWRALPATSGFRLEDLDPIRTGTALLASRLAVALPAGVQVRVETALPEILTAVTKSALVSRTGVLLLVLQFAVLAAYAIVLVAGMLADRRRAETVLMRSRGASSGHLAAMTIFEAVLLAGLAAAVAPVLALGAVQWLSGTGPLAASAARAPLRLSSDAILVDVLTAVAGVIVLTIPMLGGFGSLAGVRAAISRQTGRTLAQRLGLDLALVVVAGIALWQLRLYGAPLTRNARGVLGVDPLLVAAPGIGLLAGAVVATRIIPRIAELAERVLEHDRGLVGAMGGRGLARRPLRYTRSALLLMLAAALGTFASAQTATWTRSQGDQAAYQAGADLRMAPSQRAVSALVMGSALRELDGITAAMPVDRLSVDTGRGVRGGPLIALDAAVGASIVLTTPDADGAARAALLARLAAARPEPAGVAMPDGTRRVRVVLDAQFEPAFADPDLPPFDLGSFAGVRAGFVIEDGDRRLFRVTSERPALLVGNAQDIEVALPAGMTGPIRLRAVELGLTSPAFIGVAGTIEVVAFQTSRTTSGAPVAGESWTTLDAEPGDPAWEWHAISGNTPPFLVRPAAGAPWRVNVGGGEPGIDPVFGGTGSTTTLRLAVASPSAPVAAIAGRRFLEATGAAVGDTVTATFAASRHSVRIIGVADAFPTIDPSQAFLVVDGPTLVAERFATVASVSPPAEWWMAASAADPVGKAVLVKVDPAGTIVARRTVEQGLLTDPVPLGVIGVLGLGSIAAMLFAAIGFVVAATIATRERMGEFALLRALGLSSRELSVWLWLENAFLLVVGIVAGLGLGALLAYVVLPVSTLTSSGAMVVPAPVVELPLAAVVPVIVVGLIVFVATMLVLRGQLLQVRIGDVLRGRDE